MLGPEAQPGLTCDGRSQVTMFISVSLKKECSLRLAEPRVSHSSSTIPIFACTYSGPLSCPVRAEIVVGEEAARAVIRADEGCELAAGVVRAVVRLGRKQHDDAEALARWLAQLACQQLDDLRRPQELALEIDELASRAERARICLQDAKVTAGRKP